MSTAVGKAQAKTNAELRAGLSQLQRGTCVGINWTTYFATVNVAGGTVDVPMAGVLPNVGDLVWIGRLGNQPICLGPIPRPTKGTVTSAPAGGSVAVLGDDGVTYTIAYLNGFTPASGNRVCIDWSVPGGLILGQLSADYVPPPPPPTATPVAPVKHNFSQTFNPTDSGSYGSSWFTTLVYCSDSDIGAYFYGTQIASTIPDNATITGIQVYVDVQADSYPSNLATLGLHGLAAKSGAVGPGSSAIQIPAGSGWKSLPPAFGDSLKTGAAYGLATAHGGYHKFSPAGQSNSGALTISWSV